MALASRGAGRNVARILAAVRPMVASRSLTTQTLPDLPYDYSALEPVISAEIMKLHHDKHHNTYVNTLNQSYEKYADAESKGDIAKMLELQQAIKFNGGGMSMALWNLERPDKFISIATAADAVSLLCRSCQSQHILAEPNTTKGMS